MKRLNLVFVAPVLVMFCVSQSLAQNITPLISRPEMFHAIIPDDARPEVIVDGSQSETGLSMTEGPSWMSGKLYFSNYHRITQSIMRGLEGLHVLHNDNSCEVLFTDYRTGGTTPLPNGNIAACTFRRSEEESSMLVGIIELTPEGELVRVLADSYNGEPFVGNPNDIITDTKGGIYFTVNAYPPEEKSNVVFYLNPQGTVVKVTDYSEFMFPNGCVLNSDGSKLYLNDTGDIIIWEFDVNQDGTLTNKQVFSVLKYPENPIVIKTIISFADGMTIDMSDNLYVTSQIGIQVFDRYGFHLGVIEVPEQPSHCVFGGSDLSTLYITSTGKIFSLMTKIKGFQYPIK